MRVSVFTAAHDARHLDAAYVSLRDQSFPDWEWIVLLDGQAAAWAPPDEDTRITVNRAPRRLRGAGALKRAACELAKGEILVELDHHDLLGDACLAHVVDALDDPNIVLAYSDFALMNDDGSPNRERFDPDHGWMYTPVAIDGQEYDSCHALAATPHNLGYIWYAPNHVRAFRRSTYEEVGGYNPDLEYLDDQELMSRLYVAGEFAHVERCLYLQRVPAAIGPREERLNAGIQEQTVVYYRQFIEELTLAWARRNGLGCLQLRSPIWIGDESDDRYENVTVDPDDPKFPVDDGSVALIKAFDVLQRMPKRAAFFNECYRALAHAGLVLSHTPSSDGRGAFQDPSHTAFYNENSFMYLTQSALHDLIPDLSARFQASHLRSFVATEAHVDVQIPYVQANLLAIKDGPRQGGPLLC